jgi:hypothetical protein
MIPAVTEHEVDDPICSHLRNRSDSSRLEALAQAGGKAGGLTRGRARIFRQVASKTCVDKELLTVVRLRKLE